MDTEHPESKSERPQIAPLAHIGKKWKRRTAAAAPAYGAAVEAQETQRLQRHLLTMLSQIDYRLAEHKAIAVGVSDKLDHIHGDVMAMRETLSIQRPECYGQPPRRARARRAKKPAAPEDARAPTPE